MKVVGAYRSKYSPSEASVEVILEVPSYIRGKVYCYLPWTILSCMEVEDSVQVVESFNPSTHDSITSV